MNWRAYVVGLAAGCAVVAAQAQSRFCDRPLRVALFEYGALYRSEPGDGIDLQLVNLLAQRTGCPVQYVVMPRVRIWLELEHGTLDMATAAIPTPERQRYAYLLPYFRARNQALLRAGAPSAWRSLEGFEAGKGKLGVVRSFRHEATLDDLVARLRAQGRVLESADVQENLRLLREGVVDAVLAQPVVYRAYLSAAELAVIQVREWAPREQESVGALILSKRSFTPDQAQAWDREVVKLLRDGAVQRIYGQYLSPEQARDSLYSGPRLLAP